jgi:hypothetical protein
VTLTGGRWFQSIRVNSIRASQNGLAIDISALAPSLAIRTRAEFNFLDDNCIGGLERNGTISASEVRLTATAAPSVTADGAVALNIGNVGVQVNGLSPDLGISLADYLVTLVGATANSILGNWLYGLLTPTINNVLQGFFDAVTETPVPLEIPLNSALLRVTGELNSIGAGGTAPNGFAQFGMSAGGRTDF